MADPDPYDIMATVVPDEVRNTGRDPVVDHRLIDDDRSWILARECKDADPEIFFGDDNDLAKRYCDGCAVKERCLLWALDNREEYGVWGGLNATERRKVMKHRRRLGRCVICDSTFANPSGKGKTCSPDCYKENRRRGQARWAYVAKGKLVA